LKYRRRSWVLPPGVIAGKFEVQEEIMSSSPRGYSREV
jgi:hypothetical protein